MTIGPRVHQNLFLVSLFCMRRSAATTASAVTAAATAALATAAPTPATAAAAAAQPVEDGNCSRCASKQQYAQQ